MDERHLQGRSQLRKDRHQVDPNLVKQPEVQALARDVRACHHNPLFTGSLLARSMTSATPSGTITIEDSASQPRAVVWRTTKVGTPTGVRLPIRRTG